MTAILAALVLNESFTLQKRIGFALIVSGVAAIVWGAGITFGTQQTIGHLLFLGSALAFACYTVALRLARLAFMLQPSLQSARCFSFFRLTR